MLHWASNSSMICKKPDKKKSNSNFSLSGDVFRPIKIIDCLLIGKDWTGNTALSELNWQYCIIRTELATLHYQNWTGNTALSELSVKPSNDPDRGKSLVEDNLHVVFR
jgi:hypothetical protein